MRKGLRAVGGALLLLALGASPAPAQAVGDGWNCLLEGRTWKERPWLHHQHFRGLATCARLDADSSPPLRAPAERGNGTFELELWPDVCLESQSSNGRLSIAVDGDEEVIVERPIVLTHASAGGVIRDRTVFPDAPGVGFGVAHFMPARVILDLPVPGSPLHPDCDPDEALDMFVETTYTILDGAS